MTLLDFARGPALEWSLDYFGSRYFFKSCWHLAG